MSDGKSLTAQEAIKALKLGGWMQWQIAKRLNVSQATISAIYRGAKTKTSYRVVDSIRGLVGTPAPVRPPRKRGDREYRKPLTQQEIDNIILQTQITMLNYSDDEVQTRFARAIEAAHGIGVRA